MRATQTMDQMAKQVVENIAEQTERTIFQQFINLIRDGVIEIKREVPVATAVHLPDGRVELQMSQYVELTWKGEEVLERYKKQVQELEAKLRAIAIAVKGIGE